MPYQIDKTEKEIELLLGKQKKSNIPSHRHFKTQSGLVGTYGSPQKGYGIAVSGNYAFVADYDLGLQIMNVTNPSKPTFVSSFQVSPANSVGVAVSANYVYLADIGIGGGLHVVDVSNLLTPSLKGSYAAQVYDVQVNGNYAYLAEAAAGIQIINIANPATPTWVSTCATPGNANRLTLAGNYVYVADSNAGLQIIDVTNLMTPTIVGSYPFPGLLSLGIAVSGKYAYLASNAGGLKIMNVTNPASPTLISTYPAPSCTQNVAIKNNYAYVSDLYNGLQIINIANPARLGLAGNYATPGSPSSVTFLGNYTYVAENDAGMQIFSPGQPMIVNNKLTIIEGQTRVITSNEISVSDPNNTPSNLILTVNNIAHGYFENSASPGIPISTFNYQQILNNQILFVHDGSENVPMFQTQVSNGLLYYPPNPPGPASANINFTNFNHPPVNNIPSIRTVQQPGPLVFTGSNAITVFDPDAGNNNIQVTFTATHGVITLGGTSGLTFITGTGFNDASMTFTGTLSTINTDLNGLQFITPRNYVGPASLQITTNDLGNTGIGVPKSTTNVTSITVTPDNPPTLSPFPPLLTIMQGHTVAITTANIGAIDPDNPPASSLVFTISNLQHGQFELAASLGTPLTPPVFNLQSVQAADQIYFTQDGSDQAPSFAVSVSDGILSTAAVNANILFTPANNGTTGPGTTTLITNTAATVGGVMGGLFGIAALLGMGALYFRNKSKQTLEEAIENNGGGLSQQSDFRKKVFYPISKEIYNHIKISGCLGYLSKDTAERFVVAIQNVLEELEKQGVDINIEKMSPDHQQVFLKILIQQIRLETTSPITNWGRFFKAEVTPIQIEDRAHAIAINVARALQEKPTTEDTSLPMVRMTQ